MLIHIGYPKCASTSLQIGLEDAQDTLFLGCHPKAKPTEYYHPDIGHFFENEFRFGPDDIFEQKALNIKQFLTQSDKDHNGRVVLSYENIAFRSTVLDIPTDIKLKRLEQIIPQNSELLVIYRPVKDFLLSIYKNYLIIGYTGSIDDFLEEHRLCGDLGYLGDLDLSRLYKRLQSICADKKVHFFDLNKIEQLDHFFADRGIHLPKTDRMNEGLSDSYIDAAIAYNKNQPHQKNLLDWLELHRSFGNIEKNDEKRFYLARYRHALIEAISNAKPREFDRSAINWPEEVLKIERSNMAFIQETLKAS